MLLGDHTQPTAIAEACQGSVAIIHLSAIPSPARHPESEVFRTNVLGTYAVHTAAAITGIPCVISTSSQSAFGWAWGKRDFLPRYLPLDEDHPDEPDDGYGLSKVVGEAIAWSFHRKTGMRTIVLRPPAVTGPTGYQSILQSETATNWRATLFSYIDVRDLAQAFRCALEHPEVVCDRFNVAADDALCSSPINELLPQLDHRFQEMAQQLAPNQPMVSNARAKRLLRWTPTISWRTEVEQERATDH